MYNKLINKETRLSLIGLGYVGLPIALEFAKKIKVVGFDIKPDRVTLMKKGIDPTPANIYNLPDLTPVLKSSETIGKILKKGDYVVYESTVYPGASAHEVKEEYGLELKEKPEGSYDAVILAVSHKEYPGLGEEFFTTLLNRDGLIIDVKGTLRGKINLHTYWSL